MAYCCKVCCLLLKFFIRSLHLEDRDLLQTSFTVPICRSVVSNLNARWWYGGTCMLLPSSHLVCTNVCTTKTYCIIDYNIHKMLVFFKHLCITQIHVRAISIKVYTLSKNVILTWRKPTNITYNVVHLNSTIINTEKKKSWKK